jgi:hypothetical protein
VANILPFEVAAVSTLSASVADEPATSQPMDIGVD